MSLNIEAATAEFPASGGNATQNVVSLSDARHAFKVKSSNNTSYRVKPVYGFVDARGTTPLEINRSAGPPKDDKLVIQGAEIPAEEAVSASPFQGRSAWRGHPSPGIIFIKPYYIQYSVAELKELINRAGLLLQSEPMLPRISPTVVVVGDLHGQYLFLGDYVDRGTRSLECICLLLALKLRFPKQYILLRGNHETIAINHIYGFHDELLERYPDGVGEDLWHHINELFCFLPLAGMVGNKILCMHGGISEDLQSLEDIENLPRPLLAPDRYKLAMDLLWADPMATLQGFSPNTIRGVSTFFGEDTVAEVCRKLNIDLIIRAHQMSGYGFFANRKMITVFSAPRYQTDAPNKGAVVIINRDGRINFKVMAPDEEVRGKRVPEKSKSKSRTKKFGPGMSSKKTTTKKPI